MTFSCRAKLKSLGQFARNDRGDITMSLVVVSVIVLQALFFAYMLEYSKKSAQGRVLEQWRNIHVTSAIESFLIPFRLAEMHYYREAGTCGDVVAFATALKEGVDCPGINGARFFTNNDLPPGAAAGTFSDFYEYLPGSGCRVNGRGNGSTCAGAELVRIGEGAANIAQRISGYSFKFNMLSSVPSKGIVEFQGIATDFNRKEHRFNFAIRSTLPNSAHLEVDGRVTQANPDPLSRCPGPAWGDYLVWDMTASKCVRYAQLGSGTGLAFYNNRFFGFRPADGLVIDLWAASTASSYIVGDSGRLTSAGAGGEQIFPPYNHSTSMGSVLINQDDISVISDQVYAAGGQGLSARVSVAQPTCNGSNRGPCANDTDWRLRTVCNLGGQGWGQGISGLMAAPWSDPLLPATDDLLPNFRMASFFVKTDNGDLLDAIVTGSLTRPNPMGPEVSQIGTLYLTCNIVKDPFLQQVEYSRTNGFDRTERIKPFYLY